MNKDYYINYDNKYIIKDDYSIYKDPTLGASNKIYYDSNNSNIYSYGNIVASLIQSLTPYEKEKLRLLALFLSNQGINSLNNNDLTDLIQIVTDPQYDSLIRNIGTRLGNRMSNTPNGTKIPNPASVSVTQPTPPTTSITKALSDMSSIKEKPLNQKDNSETEQKRLNPVIESFLNDIRSKRVSGLFRGWLLPNGQLLSQFVARNVSDGGRQDHANLYKIFIAGVKEYDIDLYNKITKLYEQYLSSRNLPTYYDHDETFAVEALGWTQVSVNGGKGILCRAERWQNRLIRPFIEDYGFRLEISDFGECSYVEFMNLYDHIDEVITLGLESKYNSRLSA